MQEARLLQDLRAAEFLRHVLRLRMPNRPFDLASLRNGIATCLPCAADAVAVRDHRPRRGARALGCQQDVASGRTAPK